MKLKSKLKLYEEFLNAISENVDTKIETVTTEVSVDQSTPTATQAVRTEVIRDVDNILNNLTELSDRIEESTLVGLEMDEVFEELFDIMDNSELNEGILDFIKSPIKYAKIKKNMKAYQKALVQKAINDVDFAKKKQVGDADAKDKKRMETLDQANQAKNKALDDQLSAIAERMTELSSGDKGLAKLVSIGKTKSRLAAAKIVMKATSGEEAKQLKLEIGNLTDRIAADEQSLKDYAKKKSTDGGSDDDQSQASQSQMASLKDDDKPKTKEKEKTKEKKPEPTPTPVPETETDTDTEKLDAAVTSAQDAKDNLPEDASKQDKAKADVVLFTAKIAAAKAKGEDTKDLEANLAAAKTTAKLAPKQVGGGKVIEDGVEIDLSFEAALVEASLNGLMAYDADEDDYAYLKKQAKKLGVKVSVDKDPFGDGYDELDYSGDKAAILKLAKISGHDSDITGGPDEGGYWITESTEEVEEGNAFGAARAEAIANGDDAFTVDGEEHPVEDVSKEDEENAEEFVEETTELPKTINLDEGLTIAQKFARLM